MRFLLLPVLLVFGLFGVSSFSDSSKEDAHDQKEGETEEHGGEESSPNVGPEKGILAADEQDGFKLSPEAIKNFELQTEKLNGSGPWRLPKAALLLAGEERNIYRVRDGFYKRIDFTSSSPTDDVMTVQSKNLKTGDEVVVNGLGFLRTAELAAFGGAPEGHSH